MSIVKFLKGNSSSNLASQPLRDGTYYFVTESGQFFLDAETSSGTVTRFLINPTTVFYNTTAGWNTQTDLVGAEGCIYIYTDYRQDTVGKNIPGIKIGDGNAYLIDKPFLDSEFVEHINNSTIHVSAEDRRNWDNKVSCYLDSLNEENIVFTTN